jgi:hypothetical protein
MKMLKLATGTIALLGTVFCSPSFFLTSAYAQQTPVAELYAEMADKVLDF